jgi:uncharacterized protein (TIGR00255 family)
MTGFGRAASAGDGYNITVELKTVNNRFLDVNLRLPSELQPLENEIKRSIGSRLTRGRVDVNLQYDRGDQIEFELNQPMIEGFLNAMKEMREKFSLSGEPDINVIARLPNVVSPKKAEPDAVFLKAIGTAVTSALDDLDKMRESEGGMLADELLSRLKEIEKRIPIIDSEAGTVIDEYRTRLTKRINDLLAKSESQIDIDQGRLAQEIAYIAERADIAEELARLRAHIEHFRNIMNEDRDVGKRLDFLTQELNREANTIASKTNSILIKENALAIKNEIEKIREQVQNVE